MAQLLIKTGETIQRSPYWAVLNAQLAVECRAQHVQDLLVGLARHRPLSNSVSAVRPTSREPLFITSLVSPRLYVTAHFTSTYLLDTLPMFERKGKKREGKREKSGKRERARATVKNSLIIIVKQPTPSQASLSYCNAA